MRTLLPTCLALIIALVPGYAIPQALEITLTEGTNFAAAASPDGQTLVLDLQGTLWTLPAGGGRATAITDAYGDSRQPAWSPDGEHIAFQSYRAGNWHVWTVRADGSDLAAVTFSPADDREPAWSPDGNALAFSSDRAGNYDVWIVRREADGAFGQPVQVTRDPANDYAPSWSVDGSAVVFVSERGEGGLWRIGSDGSEPSLVTAVPGSLAGASVSPDGRRVALQSFDRRRTATALHVVDASTGQTSTVSAPGADVFPFRAAWLSDTSFLYTADGQLLRATLGSSEHTRIPFTATVEVPARSYRRKERNFDSGAQRRTLGVMSPAVSPSGNQVVLTALGDLWLLDGQRSERLTDDAFLDIQPKWAPDGSKIVFISDRGGTMQMWTRDMQSGALERVSDEAGVSFPTFSRSGKKLAYFAASPGNPLGAVLTERNLETGETRALMRNSIPATDISWLDEDTVAMSMLVPDSSRYREGTYRIAVAEYDQPLVFLDPSPELTLLQATFAPSGTLVAFLQEGHLKVARVDAQAGTIGVPRTVSAGLAESPSWTADSRYLAYQAGDEIVRLDLRGGAETTFPVDITWQPEQTSGRVVVHAGRLFDGRSPEPLRDVDVVIEGNRIVSVEPHDPDRAGDGDEVIDASDRTVIPGLFEMHAHQAAALGERVGRTWLAFGITSVREPGANAYEALERRESWASGRRVGPREFFAGPLFDGNRVFYSVAEGTDGPAHVSLALERARVLDYDMVKTYVRLPDTVQQRVAAAAHELGIPTSSHEIYPAAASGMDAVEHVGATSRRGYSPKVSALGHSYQDVVAIIAESKLNQTPTLVLPGYFWLVSEKPELLQNRQYLAFYGAEKDGTLARARAAGPAVRARAEAQGKTSAKIVAAGGRITAGTDSPFVPYGFGLHAELQLLARGGLEPWQVLRSATLWAAEAVGVGDDLGSIEPGKLADLVILNGNPLTDIADTLEVETTIKNGRVYHLDELLAAP